MMKMTRAMVPCLAVVLSGCSKSAPEEPSPAPAAGAAAGPAVGATEGSAAADPPPGEASPSSSASSAPDSAAGSGAAEPGEPTPADAAATPPGEPGALHVTARSGATMLLHPLIDGTLLASAGPLVMRVDAGGELIYDKTMLRGLDSPRGMLAFDEEFIGVIAWWPVALAGRWPDAVYLSLDILSGFRTEGGIPTVYRWDGQGWARLEAATRRYHWYPAEVHPWIDGSLLAHRAFVPRYGGLEDGEMPSEQQDEAASAAIAEAKQITVIRGAPKAPSLPPARTFASRATGEIFVVTGREPPNLVRIDAAGTEHTVVLAEQDVAVRGLVADGPQSAWVFGMQSGAEHEQPWLVRVEGERAEKAEAPPCGQTGLASFVVLGSGAQWATCGDDIAEVEIYQIERASLWHRPPGGAWTRLALPAGTKGPRQVVARADDDVWVAASGKEGGGVILHSRAHAKVLALPDLPELNRMVIEWSDPLPVDRECSFPYVPLRVAPEDAPAVKAKLDGPLSALPLEEMAVALVRTIFRDEEVLGLQLSMVEDRRDIQKVARAARKALGKEAVDEPRCWYARDIEQGELARWGDGAL